MDRRAFMIGDRIRRHRRLSRQRSSAGQSSRQEIPQHRAGTETEQGHWRQLQGSQREQRCEVEGHGEKPCRALRVRQPGQGEHGQRRRHDRGEQGRQRDLACKLKNAFDMQNRLEGVGDLPTHQRENQQARDHGVFQKA